MIWTGISYSSKNQLLYLLSHGEQPVIEILRNLNTSLNSFILPKKIDGSKFILGGKTEMAANTLRCREGCETEMAASSLQWEEVQDKMARIFLRWEGNKSGSKFIAVWEMAANASWEENKEWKLYG